MITENISVLLESINHNTVSWMLTALLCLLVVFKLFERKKNLPPGPIGLPIVGYLPFLGKYPYLTFDKLRKKYGDIFGMYLGQRYVLVLNGYEAIKTSFGKTAFLGRPKNSIFEAVQVTKSIISISGKEWEEQRRFVLHLLRDLGFGKSRMEIHIQDEIHYFIETVEKKGKTPLQISELLTPSASNNITALVFGHRLKYEDPRRLFLDDAVVKFAAFANQSGIVVFFPWLLKIFSCLGLKKFREIAELVRNVKEFVKNEIKIHESTMDSNDIRDFIDGYMLQMKADKEQNKVTSFDVEMLSGNVQMLFGAGSDTVMTTLDWAFLTLSSFKQHQQNIQEEIDNVVGSQRDPCWTDRLNMPYTQAFINEILRWRTIVPINVARSTLEDTTLEGFDIPKDTIVIANLWSVHNNPEYWEEPEVFRPERFLTNDQAIKEMAFLPFSTGRRACPGEILARIEIFLYLTTVLQKHNVSLPDGERHDFGGTLGITYLATPWKMCISRRL